MDTENRLSLRELPDLAGRAPGMPGEVGPPPLDAEALLDLQLERVKALRAWLRGQEATGTDTETPKPGLNMNGHTTADSAGAADLTAGPVDTYQTESGLETDKTDEVSPEVELRNERWDELRRRHVQKLGKSPNPNTPQAAESDSTGRLDRLKTAGRRILLADALGTAATLHAAIPPEAYEDPTLLPTIVLGGAGILSINEGSKALRRGQPSKGTKDIFRGTSLMGALTVLSESINAGSLTAGPLALGQVPFFAAGGAKYAENHLGGQPETSNMLKRLPAAVARRYTALPAGIVNLGLNAWLIKEGQFDVHDPAAWAQRLGFAGLSTSFAMKISKERFITTAFTRGLLVGALAVNMAREVIDSGTVDPTMVALGAINALAIQQDARAAGLPTACARLRAAVSQKFSRSQDQPSKLALNTSASSPS